jgi:hypothetical protein
MRMTRLRPRVHATILTPFAFSSYLEFGFDFMHNFVVKGQFWDDAMRENRERWMELAELAANEQDSKKLIELVREINELLETKQRRLDRERVALSSREEASASQQRLWSKQAETDTPQNEARQSYSSRERDSSRAFTDSVKTDKSQPATKADRAD